MLAFARKWSSENGWDSAGTSSSVSEPQLLLAFWSAKSDPQRALDELAAEFPTATIVGCSTAGGIHGGTVTDDDLIVTGVEFADARVRATSVAIDGPDRSREAGHELGAALLNGEPEPRFVFVISDGLVVNGSDLVGGIREVIPTSPISGGLAGDGADFVETRVSLGTRQLANSAVAVGVWGDRVDVNHGSASGWEPFGPARLITNSAGSTLFELDDQPALDLYQKYLGEEADRLPASALLFPLAITNPDGTQNLVRTVLSIDPDERSLRFAGDIPTGWTAQLMRTTHARLVAGAQSAAEDSLIPSQRGTDEPLLAVAVSCVGRRLVLGQRTVEEIEACLDILGEHATLSGFYSYGEIAPVNGYVGLHNQTMTLTTVTERISETDTATVASSP